MRLDSAARLEIARQGMTATSVPAAGRNVLIQRSGSVAFDVTDRVHPSVAATVALAARVVGLDVAGVDLVTDDISRPLDQTRGAIVEVNAGPGLLMHLKPADCPPRPVGRSIVDHLFPADDDGRIPIVGVTGTNGKTVVARLVARLVQKGDCANWAAGRRVLMNRSVDAAVIENDSGVILGQGWPMTAAWSAWSPTSTTAITWAISISTKPTAWSTCSAPRSTSCCPAALPCSMHATRAWSAWPSCATARCCTSAWTPPCRRWPPIWPKASAPSTCAPDASCWRVAATKKPWPTSPRFR